MEFQGLPEGCIALILSRTTPVDACRFSLVSKLFNSAAGSDAVWECFLPSDYLSIISECSLPNYPSKKALYLALADHPVIIDEGKKSFQLEKKSGKKCYMLAARALSIVWGGTEQYWNWTTDPDSRFPEVAELRDVCWLEIRGVFNTLTLSPDTQYAAYFVFKMINPSGFRNRRVEVSVDFNGDDTKNVCLDGSSDGTRVAGLQRPSLRSDGWLEIEMGDFFNVGLEDEVQMSVKEVKGGNWKSGLFVEGIEVRPKYEN
ncbi:F-box protein PP2-B10-like [Vigna umbellata]|uniref:F-box protein PP2-B10-like n=1 Tax=Vigna umbellata TaxID=87088 RepID=UPI001F5F8397|nr:F-box protein PP2-B10-like [Vigna umbellata]